MSFKISPVKKDKHIEIVSGMAREIWVDHFTPIIGSAQVEYMLEKFQSYEAIKEQINEGNEYYLAKYKNKYSGYATILPDYENSKIKLSKLYTLNKVRGKGVGLALLIFVETECKSRNVYDLWLTVNKHNRSTISWYKNRGFKVAGKEKTDIGNGYYMDDYVMEKNIPIQA